MYRFLCVVCISLFDVSLFQADAAATIMQPTLTVTSPNGGEIWQAGTSQDITWDSTGVTEVEIEYSVDGISWYVIEMKTDASAGSYTWILPDNQSVTCLVRITDIVDISINDQSNEVFIIEAAIGPPNITVISPNGGEIWKAGSTELVKWTTRNISNINIDYWTVQTGWNKLRVNTEASIGSYVWLHIPSFATEGWIIKISSVNDPSIFDQSDTPFTVAIGPKEITVLSPNGDEEWVAGSRQDIKWESTYIGDLNIDYSLDGGNSWKNIGNTQIILCKPSEITDIGMWNWLVPDSASTECLIRVQDMDNDLILDVSDNVFTISSAEPSMAESAPISFLTATCFPNPFNPQTTIVYQLPQSTEVTISIYNATGQLTQKYLEGFIDKGIHQVVFDASDSTSGLYFYSVKTRYGTYNGKMLYMK